MLRLDRQKSIVQPLVNRTLTEVGITERYDLQQLIRQHPESFFAEMGEQLLLLGEEVHPTDMVDNRIDLLAVDPEGTLVVIELKRGSNTYQLLQALSYAAMIAPWDTEMLVKARSRLLGISDEKASEQIEIFLDTELAQLNHHQRVILIAEAFDYEVLATAEWLSQRHDVDIRCYQFNLAADGDVEYLSCTCVFPLPELREQAVKRSRRGGDNRRWTDWEAAVEGLNNEDLRQFVLNEIASGRENILSDRWLIYRCGGKRRWQLGVRRDRAYVWQNGRFDSDVEFWRKTLGDLIEVAPVDGDKCLRFYLATLQEMKRFKSVVEQELKKLEFVQAEGSLTNVVSS